MKQRTILSPYEEDQDLLVVASEYSHYLQLVKLINTERSLFNQASDTWIQLYNANRTHENLVRLQLQLPNKFIKIHQAFSKLSPVLNQYCIAQHWFRTQPDLLRKEMGHWYGWSARARLAKKKYELLLFPTPEVCRFVRYADPDYYKTYLENCQNPSVGLKNWKFHKKYIKSLSEQGFTQQKLNVNWRK